MDYNVLILAVYTRDTCCLNSEHSDFQKPLTSLILTVVNEPNTKLPDR